MSLDHRRRGEWFAAATIVTAAVAGMTVIAATTAHLNGWRLFAVLFFCAVIVGTVTMVMHGTGPVQIFLQEHRDARLVRKWSTTFGRWSPSYVTYVDGRHCFYLSAPHEARFRKTKKGRSKYIGNVAVQDFSGSDVSCKWTDSQTAVECSRIQRGSSSNFSAMFPDDFEGLDSLRVGKQQIEWLIDGNVVAVVPIRIRKDGSVHRRLRGRVRGGWYRFRRHYWPDKVK